ncbi:MAG: MFS transporter [Coriobacteriales bacterium]|jgi:MFS family permease|nr:MFS transporter [Coriobacteriales bacterium]
MSAAHFEKRSRKSKPRLWTREFVLASLVQLGNATSFYLVMTSISGFAEDHLAASSGVAGTIASLFIIGAILSRAFALKLMGHLGNKGALAFGAGIALASSLFYLVCVNLWLLAAIRLAHGFGFGIITSAAPTIVAQHSPHERVGEAMGYYSLGPTFANGVGPFIGLLLYGAGNYLTIFLISAATMLVALLLVIPLRVPREELSPERRAELKGFKLSTIIEKPALGLSTVALVLYVCFGTIVSFLALFMRQIDLVAFSSVYFLVYALAVFVSRPLVGKLFDRYGVRRVLYPALALLVVGMLIFATTASLAQLVVSAVVIGLGVGTIQAATLAEVTRITPPGRSGVANTTYYLFSDIGNSGGPILAGFCIPFISYRGVYLVMAGVCVCNIIIFSAYLSRRKHR